LINIIEAKTAGIAQRANFDQVMKTAFGRVYVRREKKRMNGKKLKIFFIWSIEYPQSIKLFTSQIPPAASVW
jgi:hypothetical protein